MVKFTAQSPDGAERIIGLGLSAGNVRRLKHGDPIRIDLAEMGVEGVTLYVIYGETERQIGGMLRPYITKDTLVYDLNKSGQA